MKRSLTKAGSSSILSTDTHPAVSRQTITSGTTSSSSRRSWAPASG